MYDGARTQNTILVFGPQALAFNQDSIRSLGANTADPSVLEWVKDVVAELPDRFTEISERIPELDIIPGASLLRSLYQQLKTGSSEAITNDPNIPNILLTPLCVITHLVEFTRKAGLRKSGSGFEAWKDEKNNLSDATHAVGLCTGLLAALVVSLSRGLGDIEKYGAIAIRLAMVIGAVVDAEDALNTHSASFSAAWRSCDGFSAMEEIIRKFENAYVSVRFDENRATVTASKAHVPEMMRQMSSVGISVVEIQLSGRFHTKCHQRVVSLLNEFCESNPKFQFPEVPELRIPCWADIDAKTREIDQSNLTFAALNAILVQQSDWWNTFLDLSTLPGEKKIFIVSSEKCAPPSFVKNLSEDCRIVYEGTFASQPDDNMLQTSTLNENDIAVVGMACKVAGADDINEFWDILCKGESQHTEIPQSRLDFETAFRDHDSNRKWYGNFIKSHDSFDHKFFKKAPREAASMDPQQRLLLEIAYQAVAQSGYFQYSAPSANVGCFVGTCAVDYEYNVACHVPNAFSSTGNLRGFIAGKVSHQFGWTGPSLTLDTACSGAAVAVHQACKAILGGECEYALAGGVNMITQPLAYQNLAAASFLSQTGQCKPFCVSADGYCRGEGVGAVFLKKKSSALADGDQIFGVISGTAVSQNQNCTPIFVPNAPSLTGLFQNVLDKAGIEPGKVSYVEAHGTGTPVGDPAEYESISQVFAVAKRAQPVQLGSVKGLVGHTESSSGLVSLIKVLLMMHHSTIPPQPSHQKLSPHIKSHNLMEIATSLKPWTNKSKAALINNYGASGSNASMIVTNFAVDQNSICGPQDGQKYPFWISGSDEKSLRIYAGRLGDLLNQNACEKNPNLIRDLSFNLCRQSNRKLPKALLLSCSTVEELQTKLSEEAAPVDMSDSPALILCFGGQVSKFVGLDHSIVESTTILRTHLDMCDKTSKFLELGGIYPEIFEKAPIQDVVKLQLCLFASQYASAMSWIDCGVRPTALVGHSFGELTALCISGILSLPDTIRLITGRARTVRDQWGSDKGAMMVVKADPEQLENILSANIPSGHSVTIASYNGPSSFTLAGASEAIEATIEHILKDKLLSSIRWKRLNVTNAFHSPLVDHLKPEIERMSRDLTFKKQIIPIEFSTKSGSSLNIGPSFVPNHMRDPVYFHHAVQRLSDRHGSCVWLEAGSSSTITQMVCQALGGSSMSSHSFVPMDILTGGSTTNLTHASIGLWKNGINATFWQHHPLQTNEYAPLMLPPYQFERSKHWLELKVPSNMPVQTASPTKQAGLWIFEEYRDIDHRSIRFRVLCESEEYKAIVSSHIIAQTAPICPATLEVDMAIDALMSVHPKLKEDSLQPQILNVENQSPICLDSSRVVWLDLMAKDAGTDPNQEWAWSLTSEKIGNDSVVTTHVTGEIVFSHADDVGVQTEFARYERLVTHQRCTDLLYGNDLGDDIVQGSTIYRIFNEVVEYGARFQGLSRLVGRISTSESAGRVTKRYAGGSWLDADLSDCFSQVGGIWVNCMTRKGTGDMYIANGLEKWVRSPKLLRHTPRPETWDIIACHERRGDSAFMTDIFIFDPRKGTLVEVILGINFARISKLSMSKLLARLSVDTKAAPLAEPTRIGSRAQRPNDNFSAQKPALGGFSEIDLVSKVRLILADLSGLDPTEIKENAHLADLGIDSLMGMELARELEGAFSCTFSTDALMDVFSFEGLVQCLRQTLGLSEISDSSDANATSLNAIDTSQSSTDDVACDLEDSLNGKIGQQPTRGGDKLPVNAKQEDSIGISSSVILEAFAECKVLTDHFIEEENCDSYLELVMPRQTELCVALTLEAFSVLGCDLRLARAGQELDRINHIPSLEGLVDYLYEMLEKETGIIENHGPMILRTSVAAPRESSSDILRTLMDSFPEHQYPHMLTHFAGSRLADVLAGKSDGIKVIFGTEEGRKLASGLYADSPLNKLSYMQMRDFVKRLALRLEKSGGTLKILELGAGTGGTTKWIVPLLADLGIPVEYIFSDLSPSFVAAGRKRFAKEYPFMSFRTLDFEKEPEKDLLGSQHMVLASNAVHATHSLRRSLGNIRNTLRADGFVVLLEMTRTIYWVDMIFGLLGGWWLFDDGRRHAVAHQSRWHDDFIATGYRHVDWSDGNHAETTIQRVFLALNGENGNEKPPVAHIEARQAMIDAYVRQYTQDFAIPVSPMVRCVAKENLCILVTGTNGSLGSHIVAHLSHLPQVKTIICVNRRSKIDPRKRQFDAMESRGIQGANLEKLEIIETDTANALLGLEQGYYDRLKSRITHIVHNAWPMSGKRPLKGFENQFKVMRNLLDIASGANSAQGSIICFQFISSIAVVGHRPTMTGKQLVAEERVETAAAVLPNGYGDAKWACERMLDETLHRYTQSFRVMTVRPGQIAGSRTSGYWNHMEHFSFLVQSSQTVEAFPGFDGIMSWTPVNDVAAAVCDLLVHHSSPSYPVYHIDNPVRQPWCDVVSVLAEAIGVDVVPFQQWLQRVRSCPSSVAFENPAAKLIEFFEQDYTRMSCGGLLLDTTLACEHSESLRSVGPVSPDLVRKYIEAWKTAGVLKWSA
ncbi:unnamed protein product [Penicillium salamii]|uniref:Polyketide synthase n=1 Tax=Penicillium salamii TaxID=1612424 RepID=A0A9W4JAL8_9EURO|nr:unnamed protein product [Penicillium salamii]CAG7989592.1 unnamed protein product [Penicillium salamii]CAG8274445.1 unnamed protein product [Penicillium salamii]CAG8353731.1 unnamed protein product [Penicillium salamii]CAG8357327.1 unnamed protein product [Penicillium salamii]